MSDKVDKILKKAVEYLLEAEDTLDDAGDVAWEDYTAAALASGQGSKRAKKAEKRMIQIQALAAMAYELRKLVDNQ